MASCLENFTMALNFCQQNMRSGVCSKWHWLNVHCPQSLDYEVLDSELYVKEQKDKTGNVSWRIYTRRNYFKPKQKNILLLVWLCSNTFGSTWHVG